jgi:hypothetical protein
MTVATHIKSALMRRKSGGEVMRPARDQLSVSGGRGNLKRSKGFAAQVCLGQPM